MPTYIRPQRAIIETGGDGSLALLAFIAFVVMLAAVVAAWVLAHAVLLAAGLAVFVVTLGAFCAWCRWVASPRRFEALRGQATAPRVVQRAIQGQVVPPSRPAIAPPRWPHSINLDSLPPGQAAAIFSRKEPRP